MIDYPKPNAEELPALYDDLDESLGDIETVLRDYFEIEWIETGPVVRFGDADPQVYLDAMWADPAVMVPFFQKVTGLSDREFERLHGHSGVGNLKKRTTDFREDDRAKAFADATADLLPDELHLETVLFAFVKLWETDQRRHYRSDYEATVREYLRGAGYDAKKDESLTGKPDFVIPSTPPYQVVGEVRVVVPRDYDKRFKEFGSEARKAATTFPDAKFVAVANVPQHEIDDRREELRGMVHDLSEATIHAVIFPDELDELVSQLEAWNVPRS